MDNKKLTKKVLTEVANDLSKVMDFEKPIETGDKVTKSGIITDLKEAAKELLPKDKISDLSREVLIFLKVKLPKLEELVSNETETPEPVKQETKKGKTANPEISKRNTLTESLIAKGEFTQKEIVSKVIEKFPNYSESAINTIISDGKNPKYNRFDKLVKVVPDTKILSF